MSRPRVDQLTGVLTLILPSLLASLVAAHPGAAAAARCPSLTIVLERSGSMLLDLAGHPGVAEPAKQRWGIARAAIERAVAAYNNKLPIGLTLFPADDLCGTSGTLRIPPGYDTLAAIHTALSDGSSSPNGGGIPTCGAVRRAARELGGQGRESYLLLITDGMPSCDATCSFDPLDPAAGAVSAIAAASSASSPVKTFVLGIGSLPPAARSALTRMADAGGVPDLTNPMLKFFSVNDSAAFDAALTRILSRLVQGEGGAACDDSCAKTGCPSTEQLCLHGRCVADPCRALSCRSGEYCFSTGGSAKCVASCDKSCPAGSRCRLGACVRDACPTFCGPGSRCDTAPGSAAAGLCVPDPACATVSCADGQACLGGVCREDPCQFTACPDGLACVPFEGSCVAMSLLPAQLEPENLLSDGCAVSSLTSGRGAASGVGGSLAVALALLAVRRRARGAARRAEI